MSLDFIKVACNKENLLKKNTKFIRLQGGVSSELWLIKNNKKNVCIKRSLRKLNVAQDWFVTQKRNKFEVDYFRTLENIVPNSIPKILAHMPSDNLFIMNWFNPKVYKVWKDELLDNKINFNNVKKLSSIIAKVHLITSKNSNLQYKFSNDTIFNSIRIEPYFYFTAKRHSEYSDYILNESKNLLKNKKVLIHGDLSPKNILFSKRKVIILDAECACWGDPAFDIAFCLNHIILKSIKNSKNFINYIKLSDIFLLNYLKSVTWESKINLEKRISKLIPILLLARIDGKSPVEYLKVKEQKLAIRIAKQYIDNNYLNFICLQKVWGKKIEEYNN